MRKRTQWLLFSTMSLGVSAAAAQNVTFVSHNGAHTAYCGAPVGGPGVLRRFETLDPVHDAIAVEDDGGGGFLPPTDAASWIDAAPSSTGIVMAGAGTAQRGAPTGFGANATADVRDAWVFDLATAAPYFLDVRLSASSTETPIPNCFFSAVGFSHALTEPGEWSQTFTGTLVPGRYVVILDGRIEGSQSPFMGSFSNSLRLHIGSCNPGDFNADGILDLADLSVLLAHFGAGGASNAEGDVDGDGDVDLADLSRLLADFGASCP